MRTAYREDEDEITHRGGRHDEDDREVTLSSTTVLLIFFGLVLVCGLCFGLGYSLGHRSTPEGAISAPQTQQAAPLVASTSGQPKPSASSVTPAPVSDTPASSLESGSDASTSDETASPKPAAHEATRETAHEPVHETAPKPAVTTTTQPQIKPALVQTAQTTQTTPASRPANPANPTGPASLKSPGSLTSPTSPTPAYATPTAAPASVAAPGGSIMVQVAAISNPSDAQVLVSALRKHGFSASVHSQPTDSLLRVQVGPFATRAEAAAMKQKLLSDGYNAILK